MNVFGGLKRMLGREVRPEAFIEMRLDRFGPAGLPPPPPPPPPAPPPRAPVAGDPLQEVSLPPVPTPRPKARPSGAAVRLLMDDGSTSELDDPELSARAEYLVRNLLTPKPPAPKS